jgi:hypothetical protein
MLDQFRTSVNRTSYAEELNGLSDHVAKVYLLFKKSNGVRNSGHNII